MKTVINDDEKWEIQERLEILEEDIQFWAELVDALIHYQIESEITVYLDIIITLSLQT